MAATQIDPGEAARLARRWADGETYEVIRAIIDISNSRTAASLAVNVYASLVAQYGTVSAERFKRALRGRGGSLPA